LSANDGTASSLAGIAGGTGPASMMAVMRARRDLAMGGRAALSGFSESRNASTLRRIGSSQLQQAQC
jgi:hypothetical protein